MKIPSSSVINTLRSNMLFAAGMMIWLIGGQAQAQLGFNTVTNINLPHYFHHYLSGGNVYVGDEVATSTTGPDYVGMSIGLYYSSAAGVAPGTTYPGNFPPPGNNPQNPPVPVTFSASPVSVLLALTGCVKFPDATYNAAAAAADLITFTLTGILGNTTYMIIETITASQWAQLEPTAHNINGYVPLSAFVALGDATDFINGAPAGNLTYIQAIQNVPVNTPINASEGLTISSVGRVQYMASDPNPFDASVPEPATWPVGVAALALLVTGAYRQIIRDRA